MTSNDISTLYDQMVNNHIGKPWEVEDISNLDQCFDLAFGWCDTLGIPREAIRHQFASQIWTLPLDTTLKFFRYVPNTANGIPPRGSLVVFSGPIGHVSVAAGKGDNSNFDSFDQNWDTAHFHDGQGKPICRYVTHDYKSVLGWLVPITDPPVIPLNDQSPIPLNMQTKLEKYDSPQLGTLRSKLVAKDQALFDYQNAEAANQQANKLTALIKAFLGVK